MMTEEDKGELLTLLDHPYAKHLNAWLDDELVRMGLEALDGCDSLEGLWRLKGMAELARRMKALRQIVTHDFDVSSVAKDTH